MQDGKVQCIPKFRLKDYRKLIRGDVHIQDRRRLSLAFALFKGLKHPRKSFLPHSPFLYPEIYCIEHLSVLKASSMFVYIDQNFLFHPRYLTVYLCLKILMPFFLNNWLDLMFSGLLVIIRLTHQWKYIFLKYIYMLNKLQIRFFF